MKAWRIARQPHPVYDGSGAALVGGRWNPPGRAVIYAADSYALALLEVLAHAQVGSPPPRSRYVEIDIPPGVHVEAVGRDQVPGWDGSDYDAAQAFGRRWLEEARSAVLLVPSVVSPVDRNVVINPAHPEAASLTVSAERPLEWDARLSQLLALR